MRDAASVEAEVRARQCDGKTRYPSKTVAKRAAKRVQSRSDFHGGRLDAYECRYCTSPWG